jgi:thiamine-phosphate pyrophosphorylase
VNPTDRRRRMERSRLYVVTDARRARGDLEEFLETILEAGVDVVQLREKDAEGSDLLRWGEAFREAAQRHDALFIVNDRPDAALALEADGVHLGQNDLPVEVARRILGTDAIIGLSTHAPQQLHTASSESDYVTAGPVYETPTKPGRPAAGLEHVRYAAGRERRPWFAIGGINESNVRDVVAAGARRIAVVRAVTEAADPAAAVRSLVAALTAGGDPPRAVGTGEHRR